MTLNSRNHILQFFVLFSSIVSISLIIFFVVFLITGRISLFPDGTSNFFIGSFKEMSFFSIIILLLYVPTTGYLIFRTFEKTQSTEVIYFVVFLIGIFLIGLRLCIVIFKLENTYSSFFNSILRINFAGQILCSTSFLISSLFSEDDQIQIAERNFCILLTIAIILTNVLPINISNISLAFIPDYGFKKVFFSILIIFALLTVISLFTTWKNRNIKDYWKIPLGFVMLISGLNILTYSTTFISFLLGTFLLSWGTKLYLASIHKYYLWK